MPFIQDDPLGGFVKPRPLPEKKVVAAPDVLDTLGAAFRQENMIGSLMADSSRSFEGEDFDEAHDPFADLVGTKYAQFADRFVKSRNDQHTETIKSDIDRELQDRATLDNAGAFGVAASMAAGVFDLPTLLPGGALIRTAKGGVSVLRSAVSTGVAGGIGSTIAEVGLQTTQETRTEQESALNIGGSVVLSAVLGAGAGALVSRFDLSGAPGTLAGRVESDFNIPGDDEVDLHQPNGFVAPAGAATNEALEGIGNNLKSALGLEKGLRFQDPMLRLQTALASSSRKWIQELAETPLVYDKNAKGFETAPLGSQLGQPGSVETRIRQWQAPLADATTFLDDAFVRYRKGRSKRVGDRFSIGLQDTLSRNPNDLSFNDFKVEVAKANRRGDQSSIPEVTETAQFLRKTIFDPLLKQAQDADLLPEGIGVETAESYLNRVYDRAQIISDRDGFKAQVVSHLQRENVHNVALQGRLRGQLDEFDTLAKKTELTDAEIDRLEELRAAIQDEVVAFSGKRAKTAQTAVKRVEGASAARDPSKARLRAADKPVLEAARKIAKDVQLERDPTELDDLSDQIIDRILGTPAGRLPYDAHQTTPASGRPGAGLASPLRARDFNIPDVDIEDWLENDIELLTRAYTRSMSADIEIKQRFGSVDMVDQLKEIQEEYAKLNAAAKTPKEKERLNRRKNADLRDLAGVRDRMRGNYDVDPNPDGIVSRAARVTRNFNYVRLLGGMTISAIPDLSRVVMVHGIRNTVADGLLPMVRNWNGVKLAGDEVQATGTALDMVLDTRAMAIADIMDDFGRHSRFERGVQAATQKFGLVSLMAPWNAGMKQFAGVVTMTRILRAAENVRAGKASPKEIELLAAGGISTNNARIMAEQFGKHGSRDGGVWLARTGNWDVGTRAAREAFRGAVSRDVDRIIVTPGQDKPLFMSRELGRLILQFKSFAISSTQRTLITGLQQRDMAAFNGAVMAIALGGLVHSFKQGLRGRELDKNKDGSLNLSALVVNSVDRSGLTGWLMDANSMTEKLTSGALGLSRVTGKPVSRYAQRNVVGSFFGPTFGTLEDIRKVTQAVGPAVLGGPRGDREMRKSDIRAIRRLVPYQNLFYLREIFDQAEKGINGYFGIPGK